MNILLPQILAAVSALVMGFLWYHPKTFGRAWMHGVGMTEEKMRGRNAALRYGLALLMAFIASLLLAYVLSHPETRLSPAAHGAYHGAQMGLVLALPILVTNSLFEQRSFKTIAINVGYWIATLAVMGAIINGMNPGGLG